MKNFPLIIALVGGAMVYYLWKQRNATPQLLPSASPRFPARESVPQEWIEMTPQGSTVVGTSGGLYDILT